MNAVHDDRSSMGNRPGGTESGDEVGSAGISVGKPGGTSLVPEDQERVGLLVTETVFGTVTRFLPASLISVAIVLFLMEGLPASQLAGFFLSVLLTAGFLTAGFGLGLETLRRWLTKDAGVSGRRSVLAGLLSPLAVFISGVLSGGGDAIAVLSWIFVTGIAMATTMFFPWLARREESNHSITDHRVDTENQPHLPPGGTTLGT